MKLVAGVKAIYVIAQHNTKVGSCKIVRECTYLLTGIGVVNRIYANLAIIDVTGQDFLYKNLPQALPLTIFKVRPEQS